MEQAYFRSIWISDVHLGIPDCKAELVLEFLDSTESEYLYLVGDIIDLRNMNNDWFWPQTHNTVIQKLLAKARNGTRVVYIPGNHDQVLRQFAGRSFGPITIALEAIHVTAGGRRLLVLHGDEFDVLVKHNALLVYLGSSSYDLMQWLNRHFNRLREKLGYSYWSFSTYVKTRMKNAALYIGRFEAAAAHQAERRTLDGLICGHIHQPIIKHIGGMLYCNDGDWVESCTALVEHPDGNLQLLNWLGGTFSK
jgi:UDP-2,3-diacylglucosamine pyrophosphatase LpxH